ncbi:MAG: 30S ribosomal protein S6 [Pseudomonadota bacterium]
MPLYEHVFLARQDISQQQVEGLQQTMQSIITDNGGEVSKVEYWGLRNLTYKIKKNRKAHFSLFNISAPHAAVAEMERQIRINSDVLRFVTLRVDEHEEGPSVMMRNKDDKRPIRKERKPYRGNNQGEDDGPRKYNTRKEEDAS